MTDTMCMLKLTYISLFLLSFTVASDDKFKRDEIIAIIPKDLASLSNEDSKTLAEKFKSKISSKDKNNLFLNYHSDNDVTIGLKNQQFKYVLINTSSEMKEKSSGLFSKVYTSLSQKEKDKIAAELARPTHDAGNIIAIDLASQGLKLEFANNEKKTLKRVIMWPVDGEHP